MKHLLLENPNSYGFEYGSLKSFEETIINQLNAVKISYPELIGLNNYISNRFSHGTNKDFLRSYLPKKQINIEGDVLWIILMGPEDFNLDLFKGWQKKSIFKIVYLFDTLPHQFKLIKKLFANDDIDLLLSSFNEAIPFLEKETGREWHYIPQAVPDFFFPSEINNSRSIDFSSYGRRNEKTHEILKKYCSENNLYYDYSISKGINKEITPLEAYKQYAWHLKNSIFNFSWSVDITNPQRSQFLNPITVRWFENAASGSVCLGQEPNNLLFDKELYQNMVVRINPNSSEPELISVLDKLMESKEILLKKSLEKSQINKKFWIWNTRIKQIEEIMFKKLALRNLNSEIVPFHF